MLNIIVCICLYLCRWSFGADKSRVHKLEELQETVRVTKNAKNDVAAAQRVIGKSVAFGLVLDESWLWHPPDFETAAKLVLVAFGEPVSFGA
ncbi:hypothetical protein GLYMA_03G080250v4 [Glycine max]|nr:hypothetical protein GLYMA_03G080250v4 [Glycine max]KAH1069055.1 hypothetical protein GYH30_006588 [Glycine max]